jgi:hypothetical protein
MNSWLHKIITIFFFVLVFGLYAHNLTRDIYSGDIGDVVSASCVWGVAHPPGYPLFTVLGAVLCHIPMPLPPVTRVALISLFSSIGALIFYFKLNERITKNLYLSLLSTAILAFSYLFWFHAEVPEVFALNNVIVMALIYYAFLFYEEKKEKYLYVLSFLGGLSLAHHHTVALIVPMLFLLVIRHFKIFFTHWRIIPLMLLCVVAGLLPYLYIPIAASFKPPINWDHASDLNGFMRLVLRQDYGFAPTVVNGVPFVIKTIFVNHFITSLITTFSYQAIFVLVVGAVYLLIKRTYLLGALLVGFIISGPFFMYYGAYAFANLDGWGIIERFYLLPVLVIAVLFPYGFLGIKVLLQKYLKRPIYVWGILAYFLIIPGLMIWYNYPRTDLSKTQIGTQLAKDIMDTVPKNSFLFVSGDTTAFNIWYVHYVLGYRKDLNVINPAGVQGQDLLYKVTSDIQSKDKKLNYTQARTTAFYMLMQRYPFYSTYLMQTGTEKNTMLQRGMAMQLISVDQLPPVEEYKKDMAAYWSKITLLNRDNLPEADQNLIAGEIPLFYANALLRTGDALENLYGDYPAAEEYYKKAIATDPKLDKAYAMLGVLEYKKSQDCNSAIALLKKAIEIYPVTSRSQAWLYQIYGKCNAPQKLRDDLKKQYKQFLKKDIDKDEIIDFSNPNSSDINTEQNESSGI